jgi:hypothetical protein
MAAETLADGADNDLLSAYPARAHAIVGHPSLSTFSRSYLVLCLYLLLGNDWHSSAWSSTSSRRLCHLLDGGLLKLCGLHFYIIDLFDVGHERK